MEKEVGATGRGTDQRDFSQPNYAPRRRETKLANRNRQLKLQQRREEKRSRCRQVGSSEDEKTTGLDKVVSKERGN